MDKVCTLILCLLLVGSLLLGCRKKDTYNDLCIMEYSDEEIFEKIADVYIPPVSLVVKSRAIYFDDIAMFLDIIKEKTDAKTFVIKTDVRKLVLVFGEDDRLTHMFNLGNEKFDKNDFDRIKVGDSFSDVLKIDPSALLCKNVPKVLNEEQPKCKIVYSEHILANGNVGVVEYQERNGEYFVNNIYIAAVIIDKNLDVLYNC